MRKLFAFVAVLALAGTACSTPTPTTPATPVAVQGETGDGVSAQSVTLNVAITHPPAAGSPHAGDNNYFRYQAALHRSRGETRSWRIFFAYKNVYGTGAYWYVNGDSVDLIGNYPYCAYPNSCTAWSLTSYAETVDGAERTADVITGIGQGTIAIP